MKLEVAVDVLMGGGLVALPTETVYGLAADAGNEQVVRGIFELKGRPASNPLIVHVADVEAARRVVADWPTSADELVARHWPGPLTIVLPKASSVPDIVTAAGPTVAVRVPDHPMTLDVLRRLHARGVLGLAMPSANRSEHVSPTTAQHVRDEFGDAIPILDGGQCNVGIESTVVDLTGRAPHVLRPGSITINASPRPPHPRRAARPGSDRQEPARSPGQHRRHYAPNLPVRLIDDDHPAPSRPVLLLTRRTHSIQNTTPLRIAADAVGYASELYAALRRAEKLARGTDLELWIEMPPDEPEWAAVRDRLRRAASRLD
ncbi:MAG: L-threonylcarbamoyladenylate synthase [Planctomycetota bacterium]